MNIYTGSKIKATFCLLFFSKIGDDLNSFLVCCSQFAAQLEGAVKEESHVCILCKLLSIKYCLLF